MKTCDICYEEHEYPSMGEPTSLCIKALNARLTEAEKERDTWREREGMAQAGWRKTEKERAYLLDKHSKCIGDAIDGQAALDEANNKIVSVEKRAQKMGHAIESAKGHLDHTPSCVCLFCALTSQLDSEKECDTKPLRIKSGDLPPPKGITFDPPDACPHGKALKDCPNCVGIKE